MSTCWQEYIYLLLLVLLLLLPLSCNTTTPFSALNPSTSPHGCNGIYEASFRCLNPGLSLSFEVPATSWV